MRDLTKDNITEAFLRYCNQDVSNKQPKDSRTMEIMACLAKHLHAFALEAELTDEEWTAGIKFMHEVGEKTTPDRDEFILLSDVLGLSSLVDMINNNKNVTEENKTGTVDKIPTSSSVLGPFHLSNPPKYNIGADLKRENTGELVLVQGTIMDSQTGNAIEGAEINVWQTAPNGFYCSQDPNQEDYNFHGIIGLTRDDGRYAFTTSKPVPYQIPTDGPVGDLLKALGRHAWRPSHLHLIVKAEGYKTLVTEIFPRDDPYLDSDAVFGVRNDLVLVYTKQPANSFPPEGFDLSGKVDGDFLRVDFDLVLLRSV